MACSKTVLITGAARGIGRATAEEFASHGYNVVLTYLTSDKEAAATAAALSKITRVELFRLDVRDSSAVDEVFEKTLKIFPSVDVVINNAGVADSGLLTDVTDVAVASLVDTNLKGAVFVSRAAVRAMLKRDGGSIINVASVWGVLGGALEVVYSATKAGLIGMTLALAKETDLMGIRVNAVAPGAVDTGMLSSEQKEYSAKHLGLCDASTVAAAIFKLATDGDSGQVLRLFDEKLYD